MRVFADTNVFLRYLTNDIPEQADAVETLLEQAENGVITLVTNVMVIAEMVWVLSGKIYGYSRQDISRLVLGILNTPGVEVESADILTHALSIYARENIDFIDAYIAVWLQNDNMDTIYTFNAKHFSRVSNLNVIVPK